jgi:prolipoprotein diacylglyceryl transferase
VLLFIPSPPINGFSIGPVTIRFYALCLIAGIFVAYIVGLRRWRARGGQGDSFETAVFWAVPLGIVGARVYHVLTHLGDYFGPGINPWSVFFIWQGGIAIFGAVSAGALGLWIGCRQTGVRFSSLADALVPGVAFGQAIGRFGNWFNQELYGRPTNLPWGLEIDSAHRVPGYENYSTFHPTFLYESVWNVLVGLTLLWADKKFTLGRGKVFALYVALYGFGRSFTEGIRLDYSYDTFGPLRFNQAVAILICLCGVALFAFLAKAKPGREDSVLQLAAAGQAEGSLWSDGSTGAPDQDGSAAAGSPPGGDEPPGADDGPAVGDPLGAPRGDPRRAADTPSGGDTAQPTPRGESGASPERAASPHRYFETDLETLSRTGEAIVSPGIESQPDSEDGYPPPPRRARQDP